MRRVSRVLYEAKLLRKLIQLSAVVDYLILFYFRYIDNNYGTKYQHILSTESGYDVNKITYMLAFLMPKVPRNFCSANPALLKLTTCHDLHEQRFLLCKVWNGPSTSRIRTTLVTTIAAAPKDSFAKLMQMA